MAEATSGQQPETSTDDSPDRPPYVVTHTFEDFYRHEASGVARALALTLRDVDLASEATDEAMARAYARWSKVRRLDRPAGWVYRVGLNWALSQLRKRRPERLRHDVTGSDLPVDDPAVGQALAALPIDLRAVVVCRHYFDWSVSTTAKALGVKEGTVKSRLSRASALLAIELEHLR